MYLKEIDLYETYKKWYKNAGPYRCFFRTTNFVSLKNYPDFPLEEVAADHTLEKFLTENLKGYAARETLFLFDLPGEKAVQAAYLLQLEHKIKPVLTFNNFLHAYGINGSRRFISSLLNLGQKLEDIEPDGYAIILDNHRYGDFSDETYRKCFNNLYEITEYDVPSIEMLQELNCKRVVYFYLDDIKEDVGSYLDYLKNGSFEVMIKEMLGDL